MIDKTRPLFPFSAIAGQLEMKLALILNAIYPAIGGVVISGTRGSAKSTTARALAEVLPAPTPFVNLPVGATEDRVLGTLDIEKALQHGQKRFDPGLLAQAHNGILYIDEVNLLPDHLVDVILDAAAMGVNRIEREGISYEHAANIILIGTMNPEEGELRPQLLDRFGLCATVEPMSDNAIRKEAMRRRLAFDDDPAGFCASYASDQEQLKERIERGRELVRDVKVGEEIVDAIVTLAAEAGADGLRADLSLHRAVRALAAWEGRNEATLEDLYAVSELALAHRRRRRNPHSMPPQIPPSPKPQELPSGPQSSGSPTSQPRPDTVLGFGEAQKVPWRDSSPDRPRGPSSKLAVGRGKGERFAPRGRSRVTPLRTPVIAFPETVRVAALRRSPGRALLPLDPSECLWRKRVQKRRRLVVFIVDASGSMTAMTRMRAAKSAAIMLLEKAYRNRCFVTLMAFRDRSATVLLQPTRSVFHAFQKLRELPAGGTTPLAEGLRTAFAVVKRALDKDPSIEPLLVLITDGRANYPAAGAFVEAEREAAWIAKRQWRGLCIDTESGTVRFAQTRRIASLLNADYVHCDELPRSHWAPIIEEWLSWQ